MNNKIDLKKYLIITIIFSVFFIIINTFVNYLEYKNYTNNFNKKIDSIIYTVKEKYPNIKEKEIIDIINSKKEDEKLLNKYGIDIKKDSIIKENEALNKKYNIYNLIIYFISFAILISIFIIYDLKKTNKINDITKYIKEINKRNYKLNIDDMSEDELSILKQEIYKITVKLKEASINANKDKIELKKSLEDISHQLKTPLTSIIIMLDNIIDNPNMDNETKDEFIKDIKKEIENINFLVQALLKLSKFDSNTIAFNSELNSTKSILEKSIKNVSILCDLKDVTIELNIKEDTKIKCDFMWQVEALTNIIKNCVEHSKNNDKVTIDVIDKNTYLMINIKNIGDTIDEYDKKHIFERFYKGKNAKKDSMGIGLSLSKTIIEKDNGNISLDSKNGETTFTVRYFKI